MCFLLSLRILHLFFFSHLNFLRLFELGSQLWLLATFLFLFCVVKDEPLTAAAYIHHAPASPLSMRMCTLTHKMLLLYSRANFTHSFREIKCLRLVSQSVFKHSPADGWKGSCADVHLNIIPASLQSFQRVMTTKFGSALVWEDMKI